MVITAPFQDNLSSTNFVLKISYDLFAHKNVVITTKTADAKVKLSRLLWPDQHLSGNFQTTIYVK